MSLVSDEGYWTDEFEITVADLERIARYIGKTEQAHDLMELARRVVRGRLRHGPESSPPAQRSLGRKRSVRLWDPAAKWQVGDHAIFTRFMRIGEYEVHVGEVTHVEPSIVHVFIPSIGRSAMYNRARPGSEDALKWHALVRRIVEAKRLAVEEGQQIDRIILEHGERIGSQLLDALCANERFVRLAGHWFLSELAVSPTEEQLSASAWAMVAQEQPQPTEDLLSLVHPPLAEGDPGLFGLYLGIRDRQDLFENVDPGKRPRWALAGPPPGSFIPSHAAYDPETYEVLCLPGEATPPEVVNRLWDVGLLKAVI